MAPELLVGKTNVLFVLKLLHKTADTKRETKFKLNPYPILRDLGLMNNSECFENIKQNRF